MNVVVNASPAPKPTKEELKATLARYQRRVASQDERVEMAAHAAKEAEAALAKAATELKAAIAARKILDTYIAELTAQIGE